MPNYAQLTRFLIAPQPLGSDDPESFNYSAFLRAYHEAEGLPDYHYGETLTKLGLSGAAPWHANVEGLGLEGTLALLTFLVRADDWSGGSISQSLRDGYLTRVLRRLAELDGTYESPTILPFYHEYDPNGCFSNWYASPFAWRGVEFASSEHYMMWEKAFVFGDTASMDAVLEAPTPAAAKALGKGVKPFDPSTWDSISEQLMLSGLRHKFTSSEKLYNALLATGSALMCEAAPPDHLWGIGIAADDPCVKDPSRWKGKNMLGRCLMQVRGQLRELANRGVGPQELRELTRDGMSVLDTQVERMTIGQLACVPAARPAVRAWRQICAWRLQKSGIPVDVADGYTLGAIQDMMSFNMGGGLPVAGWYELLDELSVQHLLGRL